MNAPQQQPLFDAHSGPEHLAIDGGELRYWPDFLSRRDADYLQEALQSVIHWQQQRITMYGKSMDVPRLTAWYGDSDSHYRWSGIDNSPRPWHPELARLRDDICASTGHHFNSVLLNLYRDGSDSVAWHADDEPELGTDPVIASLSLGAERCFQMKHRDKPRERFDITLAHGSLLLMAGATQSNWLHQVPKCRALGKCRINLTFRRVQPPAQHKDQIA